ncbi:MAG: M28 family peptidase [Acidobacteriota bacterium]|jgi:Zn-dependent M28 family amino/carboxypeptidase|nr:M28 family peptidase [Acidobacteriota bacterium]
MRVIKFTGLIAVLFALAFLTFSVVSDAQRSDSVKKDDSSKSNIIDAKSLIEDIKYLSSDKLKGRETGTAESGTARQYILKRFGQSGIKPLKKSYIQKFSFTDQKENKFDGVNVFGFIKGKTSPNKYIVISAHYDHVGVNNGEIYNGADDNASGTSALFAIAKYFKKNKPNNSIIFAAFDAEEKGLQGARYFVDNLPVSQSDILLNINMDMVSRNDKGELYAAGTFHYPNLKPYIEAVQKNAPVKLLLGHDDPKLGRDDWTFQSDHGAFHRKKIPFIYFGVEDHKDYHKPTDDFENIQPKFYVNAVETIVMAVKSIDENWK